MSMPTDSTNQRQRIIEYLQKKQNGATTLELVKELDVLRPGARIHELRQHGYNIFNHWTIVNTHLGRHKNARYVLLSGGSYAN